jgi:hypothetical protein
MNYITMIRSSLRELSSAAFEVLEVHSYDANLEIETFNTPFQFYLSKPVFFKARMIALCFYKSAFVVITFNPDGRIINSESGIVDDEVVWSSFGFDRNEV